MVGMDDCILSFTAIVPLRPNSSPLIELGTIGFGDTPTLTMARSMSIVSVAPGIGTGLRRPDASGSPNSIF